MTDQDMAHMGERWVASYSAHRARWIIRSKRGVFIFMMYRGIPGDPTGERTARAIVEAHNKAIGE